MSAKERIAKLEDEALRLQVEDAKSDVARIEAQRAMSERQLRRIEGLANNSISQTQLDEVRSQLAVLTAQLQQAQVRQRAAQHSLAQTEVRAPFPGIVTERLAQRGEYVTTGSAIVRLVDFPRVQPALAVQRAGVAGHVRSELYVPAAEGESAAADAIDVRNEREAGGVEHLFGRTVAFAQYRPGGLISDPFERRNTPANRRA